LLLKNLESYRFKITVDGKEEIVESSLILINNQPILGGNFQVAPKTIHNDGKFNLTIFKHNNRLELISCLVKILNNEFPLDDKNLKVLEIDQAKIELLDAKDLSFFGDGEVFERSMVWDIKLYPNFLTVFSPKDQEDLTNICTKVSLM
jgi:diacylglycerol kinase family enzyme